MAKRLKRVLLSVTTFVALALGAGVIANAQTGSQTQPPPAKPKVHHAARHHHAQHRQVHKSQADQPGDQGNQPGDQTEQPGNETESPENGETETAPGSDGPNGHADEPGNPTADHQFQGVE
jgi:hypothetical protein